MLYTELIYKTYDVFIVDLIKKKLYYYPEEETMSANSQFVIGTFR